MVLAFQQGVVDVVQLISDFEVDDVCSTDVGVGAQVVQVVGVDIDLAADDRAGVGEVVAGAGVGIC